MYLILQWYMCLYFDKLVCWKWSRLSNGFTFFFFPGLNYPTVATVAFFSPPRKCHTLWCTCKQNTSLMDSTLGIKTFRECNQICWRVRKICYRAETETGFVCPTLMYVQHIIICQQWVSFERKRRLSTRKIFNTVAWHSSTDFLPKATCYTCCKKGYE